MYSMLPRTMLQEVKWGEPPPGATDGAVQRKPELFTPSIGVGFKYGPTRFPDIFPEHLISISISSSEKAAKNVREFRRSQVPIAAVWIVLPSSINVLIVNEAILHPNGTGDRLIFIDQTTVQRHLIAWISQIRPLLDLLGNGGFRELSTNMLGHDRQPERRADRHKMLDSRRLLLHRPQHIVGDNGSH